MSAVLDADVLVLATPWPEFAELPRQLQRDDRSRVVIDCWRMLDGVTLVEHAAYVPLGTGRSLEESVASRD
jgi:predicted dinucleotide-binding enzyme